MIDLTRYVPRVAARFVGRHEPWLAVDGSLVFADVSGFTALSERLAAAGRAGTEELTTILDSAFGALLDEAYAEGGDLLKFGGDALLLLYDEADHAVRASRAAVRMRAAMRKRRLLTTSVGRVRLQMSQGVYSGSILIFRAGGLHTEVIVTGPAAAEVARLEAAASPDEVIISSSTFEALTVAAPRLLGSTVDGEHLLATRAMVAGEAEAPRMRTLRSAARFVPAALRAYLRGGGGEVFEHRHVAVGFVHICGCDALLAERGTEGTATALDHAITAIQVAAANYHVTFLGTDLAPDGAKVILVAGAPSSVEDPEGVLLRAAHELSKQPPPLELRVGVNAGRVFAGGIGTGYRRTYTVMGDAVNLAARLMSHAGAGDVLAHESVVQSARVKVEARELSPFHVKGKRAAVRALRVEGLTATSDQGPPSTEQPIVGRDREIEQLLAVIRVGGVADVVGGVGAGKSRLLRAVADRLPTNVGFALFRCNQYESAAPYLIARRVLEAALRGPLTDGRAVTAAVRAIDAEAAGWAPLVAEVLGTTFAESAATEHLRGQFRRDRTARVVAMLVAKALPGGVLAIDDAQWLDDASRDVFARLATAAAGHRLTLLLARRPGKADQHLAEPIELAPLPDQAARRLIRNAAHERPPRPDQVDAIVRRGAGNPLFLEELVRFTVERDGDLPVTLEAVIGQEIDALAPRDRALLRQAAVLGTRFELSLLAAVVDDLEGGGADGPGESVPATTQALARRLRPFLRSAGPGGLEFRHGLVRDVAYEGLPFNRRRGIHARAADAIERSGGGEGDELAALSMHLFHAGQFERSWRYALEAARPAVRRFALIEGIELYERAAAASRRAKATVPDAEAATTWREFAQCLQLAGRLDEAAAAYRQARRLYGDDRVRVAEVCTRQSQVAARAAGGPSAVRWIQRGLRGIEDDETPEAATVRGDLLAALAFQRLTGGRERDAIGVAQAAIAEGERAGDRMTVANASHILGLAHQAFGHADSMLHMERALKIFEEQGELQPLATHLHNLGASASNQGRLPEALSLFERAREYFLKLDDLIDAGYCDCNAAGILISQGRLDEAVSVLDSALDSFRGLDFRFGVALATRHLGGITLKRGSPSQAREQFTAARAVFEQYEQRQRVAEMDILLAECALATGELDEARELLDAAAEACSEAARPMLDRVRERVAAASSARPEAEAEAAEAGIQV